MISSAIGITKNVCLQLYKLYRGSQTFIDTVLHFTNNIFWAPLKYIKKDLHEVHRRRTAAAALH